MPEPLVINDLRGGESDEHPGTLQKNQVATAQNVEYFRARIAGRRNGSSAVLSGLASELQHLIVYTPDSASTNDRLWTLNAAGEWVYYDSGFTGTTVTPDPADLFLPAYPARGVSLHGKLFIASKSTDSGAAALNRLHVYDGTTLRRAGLAQPAAAPNVADTGAGSFNTTRYYRVRYATLDGSTVIRRSEPSSTTTFVPSGTGASARITKPAAVNEGETHWEVEESINNADFYRIATVEVATTTYDDSLAKTAVATSGTLSEDIGDYSVQASYRFLAVDRDRLIGFGNYEDAEQDSDVVWTPVGNDPGVSNDERVPTDTGNRVRLDGQDGGRLTGGVSFDGRIIAFKEHRIYSLTQTGIRSSAYLPQPVSRTYGAMEGSVVEGTDAEGRPALYFVDSKVGPIQMGAQGLIVLCPFLQKKLLAAVNFAATFATVNSVYHSNKNQVWWTFAGTGENAPSFRWVYDVKTGGTTFHTLPALAYATALWTGKPHVTGVGGRLVKCDDENATDDYGNAFRAYIVTGAYELGQLIARVGMRGGMLEADVSTGVTVTITQIRDYGAERVSVTASLSASGTESYIIRSMDNLLLTESSAVQFEIGDAEAVSVAAWQLHKFALLWDLAGRNI